MSVITMININLKKIYYVYIKMLYIKYIYEHM
jgi:hypothetical protein